MHKVKTLIMIPTYNEKDNVVGLFHGIRSAAPNCDILFIDDNSPDGTGILLDEIAAKNSQVSVIHREGRLGVGSAHLCGIWEAYARGYGVLLTMDADFTHSPESIPKFLKMADEKEVVVGSRYLQSDSLSGWNPIRLFLTWTGHILTNVCLDLKYDSTGGFRVYRLDRIPKKIFSLVKSKSYSFFFESLYILNLNGCSIGEIPVRLPPRTYGHSKMRFRDIFKSLSLLFHTFFRRIFFSNSLICKDCVAPYEKP